MNHSLLALAVRAVLMSPTPGAAGGGSRGSAVQVPGAAAASAADQAAATSTDAASSAAVDPRDDEIAALRAELAAARAKANPAADLLVMEADGPNTRRAKAESKHMGYTSDELDKLVREGKVKMTDHHVLCKDGWYVNPEANKQANG